MTGDQDDMLLRLRQTMPQGWIPWEAPVFSALLAGLAAVLAFFYSLYAYVTRQTRILWASEGFLDLIASDFFGLGLRRESNESDDNFRARILVQMFRERATRRALIDVLTQLTGHVPLLIEPGNPSDTGALGSTLALGVHGCIGSISMPYQAFVTVYREASSLVPNVPGLGDSACGLGAPAGAVLIPEISLHSVADRNIYAAIDAVKPIGTTVWARITS